MVGFRINMHLMVMDFSPRFNCRQLFHSDSTEIAKYACSDCHPFGSKQKLTITQEGMIFKKPSG